MPQPRAIDEARERREVIPRAPVEPRQGVRAHHRLHVVRRALGATGHAARRPTGSRAHAVPPGAQELRRTLPGADVAGATLAARLARRPIGPRRRVARRL